MSQEHVRLLKRAARLIRNQESDYICDALRLSGGRRINGRPWSARAYEIKSRIDKDLGGHFSLASWLENHYNWRRPLDYNDELEALRATRLEWIDAMIEYWRDK